MTTNKKITTESANKIGETIPDIESETKNDPAVMHSTANEIKTILSSGYRNAGNHETRGISVC